MADGIKRYSVTRNDATDATQGAPIIRLILNATMTNAAGLPDWWTPRRDHILRQTLYLEPLWASAINIAITKMASLKWIVEGDAPRIASYAQDLLLSADGNADWVSFISRQLQDYLLTDNGQFCEIVRATKGIGSRVLGLVHLDSLRVTRTGDPEMPAIYRDTQGVEHILRAHQVIMLSDMPSPSETWHGVGLCAASRAWLVIQKMAAIENYIYDKVSGKRALSVDFVNGISHKSMQSAIESAREMREAQSVQGAAFSYMGATLVPILDDVPLKHVRVNFAELPDGFDRDEEFNIGVLQYADALGLDPQDLQPLSGRPLGSGEQSIILDQKAAGRGIAAWRQAWTHNLNQFVMPDRVTFAFTERNLQDEQANATLAQTRTATVMAQIQAGIITPAQGAQILADEDIIPREFVPEDTTSGTILSDDAKLEQEQAAQGEDGEQEQPDNEQAAKTMKTKGVDEYIAEYDNIMTPLVRKTFRGKMTARELATEHRNVIRALAPQVYFEGLRQGGVEQEDADDDDRAAIKEWIAGQVSRVSAFARAVADAGKDKNAQEQAYTRLDMWLNALRSLGDQARMSAQKNAAGTWVLGKTEEHCATCLKLNGKRHRLKWYLRNGYIPQEPGSETLECGGFNCDCEIRDDNGKRLLPQ